MAEAVDVGRPPRSASTGKPYAGVNVWLLTLSAMERGYRSPWWMTYRQADQLGGQVRKGERGTMVTFWKTLADRLHRFETSDLPSRHEYGLEELAAEMGASLLRAETGLGTEEAIANSAAYLQSWIETIKEDSEIVIQAAAKGQKIADHVLEPVRELQMAVEAVEPEPVAQRQAEVGDFEAA